MKSQERYAKNLELFARDNPLYQPLVENAHLDELANTNLHVCKTQEEELNLIDESQTPPLYLHLQEGALWEAEYWASKLPLTDCDVVFVYGIGLGYYFLPLKEWLAENPGHYLVFLEDDPHVITHFLQTVLATELLENPQVVVKLLPQIEPNEEGWTELRVFGASLFWDFAFLKPYMSALQSYFVSRSGFFKAFSLQWLTNLSRAERSFVEFYPFSELVVHNFYANLPYLGETIPGYHLAGTMHGIPAVLCGAGPSLQKQLPLLKGLSEQAFIIASGSAMNALTHDSIIPHLGGAIDPTATQASRQLTSFGYDVPAFYQNRFHDKAFVQWHGPLLFMVGSGSNRLSQWFEKELGIVGAEQIIMGVSTSNFLVETANFLGCNPIILVGMDLAYTEDHRYVKGVEAHPADDKKQHEDLNKKQELLIAVPGVDGKDVYITNQWFYEAVCLAAFKERNPQMTFLNATEGGMAIPTVDNIAFAKAIKEHCHSSWDIQGWFHGAIQNASQFSLSTSKVLQAIKKWKRSLESCKDFLNQLAQHFQDLVKHPETKSVPPFIVYSEKAALWQQDLQGEISYEFLLEDLNTAFERLNGLRIRKLKWIKNKQKLAFESITIEMERYQFLKDYVEGHLKSIQEGQKAFKERKRSLADKIDQKEHLPQPVQVPEYRLNDDTLSFQEPSLGLSLTTSSHSQKTLYFYPGGQVKAEAFYKTGKLHGPWSFYSEEGILLFRSWFVDGKKEGVSVAYYLTGELYSLQGYFHGLAQGEHRHYFSDGTLKTLETYHQGKLHGVVRLYYSNGRLKKEQYFVEGKLNEMERMWDERGILIIEASYKSGKVVGVFSRLRRFD